MRSFSFSHFVFILSSKVSEHTGCLFFPSFKPMVQYKTGMVLGCGVTVLKYIKWALLPAIWLAQGAGFLLVTSSQQRNGLLLLPER